MYSNLICIDDKGIFKIMKTYLLNVFSLQMVDIPCSVRFEEVDFLPDGLTSAIGHQYTQQLSRFFVK